MTQSTGRVACATSHEKNISHSRARGGGGAGSRKEEVSLGPCLKTGRQDVVEGEDVAWLLCTVERHLSPQDPAEMETGSMFIREEYG